jgi:hypothetical protein
MVSTVGGPNARRGRSAAMPSSWPPHQHTPIDATGAPAASTPSETDVESSSGASARNWWWKRMASAAMLDG